MHGAGTVLDEVVSPVDGILFTIREYPIADGVLKEIMNYNWQVWDTQAFSFYTATTTRIDRKSAGQSVLSIMKFLSALGIVKYQHQSSEKESVVVRDTEMISVQTAKSGIFEPLVKVGDEVSEGTPLANIVHPYDGEVMETLYAPKDGRIFFMHTDPLTYANTAVFKLV